jgi:hypothetical protein
LSVFLSLLSVSLFPSLSFFLPLCLSLALSFDLSSAFSGPVSLSVSASLSLFVCLSFFQMIIGRNGIRRKTANFCFTTKGKTEKGTRLQRKRKKISFFVPICKR